MILHIMRMIISKVNTSKINHILLGIVRRINVHLKKLISQYKINSQCLMAHHKLNNFISIVYKHYFHFYDIHLNRQANKSFSRQGYLKIINQCSSSSYLLNLPHM